MSAWSGYSPDLDKDKEWSCHEGELWVIYIFRYNDHMISGHFHAKNGLTSFDQGSAWVSKIRHCKY